MSTLMVLDLLTGALDIVFLGGLLVLINYYTSGPATNRWLPFNFGRGNNPVLFTGAFVLLYCVKNYLVFYISAMGDSFFYRVASRLSRQNLFNYLKSGYSNYVQVDSSVYIRKISQQPIEFSSYVLTNIQQVITQSILIIFTIAAILFYHPALFILLFVLLLPPVFLTGYFIKKRLGRIRSNIKTTSERAIQHLQESLTGYVESNVYNKSDFFVNRYHQYQQQLNENISTQQSLQALPPRLIEVFAILGFFVLVIAGKLYGNADTVSLLNVGVFMAAAYKIIPGIVKMMNSLGQIKTYGFVVDDLAALSAGTEEAEATTPTDELTSIEFKNVYFNYRNREVLNGMNFVLQPGDFVGVFGKSGMGKTTIINLLLGFLEQDRGRIILNGKISNSAERKIFQNNISYVKQQPFLINDTILRNITLSDNSFHSGRLAKAMTISGVDRLLELYPEGIDKQITENGKNISGGQRQRIALARALYHDFDLLILDEPFSELDGPSEKNVLLELAQLAQDGKMILFITHNKASLQYCSKLISFDAVYEA